MAPEVKLAYGRGEKGVCLRSDVWSFGCIFSEVLAFALGGADEVQRFVQMRLRGSPRNADRNDDFFTQKTQQNLTASSRTILDFETRREVYLWLDSVPPTPQQ